MPIYEFICNKCNKNYEELTSFDKSGKYESVECPECGSKSKERLQSAISFNFSNPEGTDRWNNSSTGHDYRFKHNIPKVKQERETAERLSHMGANPYKGKAAESDFNMGEGIHDPESRGGLA